MSAETVESITATQALGVALSVAAPTMTMHEAQVAAPAMEDHLRRIGYILATPTEAQGLDVALLARALHRWEARHDPEREDVSAIVGVAVYEDGDLLTAQEIAAEYSRLAGDAAPSLDER